LPVTFTSSNTNIAAIVNGKIQIKAAGNCKITASQMGNESFEAAIPIERTLTIKRATLTCTAIDTSRKTGAVNPTFRLSITGFVKNEGLQSIKVMPTAICTANVLSPAGIYDITPSGGNADNYNFTYVKGKLHVDASTGIDNLKNSGLFLYPNPCQDKLEIAGLTDQNLKIYIYDCIGKLLITQLAKNNKINVSFLSPGIYFLKVGSETLRFIKN